MVVLDLVREIDGEMKEFFERIRNFAKNCRGQMVAEYSVLMWFSVLLGAAALVTVFFAFEESTINYYENIVKIICLPVP